MDGMDAAQPQLEPTLAWLVRLRWVAVFGEAVSVAVAYWWLAQAMSLRWAFALIGLTAISNLLLMGRTKSRRALRRSLFVQVLFFDTVTFTALLACTGGMHNPFASFYLVHVAMAAVALGSSAAWGMALLAIVGYGSLFLLAGPHMHHAVDGSLHLRGMLCATALTAGCIAYFVGHLNRELRARERALGEMRLLREQNARFAALTTLAAGVAHELGSPLGTIAVVSNELRRLDNAALPHDIRADVNLIREEVERCRSILGRLNVRSAADLAEASSQFTVRSMLDSVVAALSPEQCLRFRIVCDHPEIVLVLPCKTVTQAIISLVKNAFDASDVTQNVWLRAAAKDDRVAFTISDEGIGLPSDNNQHIGEPFFTTKEPGKGMGLGLFLVRLLSDRLDGSLTIEPRAPRGTTALFVLPRRFES